MLDRSIWKIIFFLTPLSTKNTFNHNNNNLQLSQILKVKHQPPKYILLLRHV